MSKGCINMGFIALLYQLSVIVVVILVVMLLFAIF